MSLIQYISFSIDKAIEMLMDSKTSKMDVALFLMNFKKIIKNPQKEIIDGECSEIETKCIECKE